MKVLPLRISPDFLQFLVTKSFLAILGLFPPFKKENSIPLPSKNGIQILLTLPSSLLN
jgi:hypothetical protein